MPVGLRSRVPAKMTSSMREPRSVLADCSPSTQEMASAILDLPHPLGPMMAAMPSPWNFNSVRSQKDLNPRICSFFSLSKVQLQWSVASFQLDRTSAGSTGCDLAIQRPHAPVYQTDSSRRRCDTRDPFFLFSLTLGWTGRAQIEATVTAKTGMGQAI